MGPDMTVCILLFLASLSSVDGGQNLSRPMWEEECREPCSGEQCNRLKALLKEEVDTDLDPCGDFYQFACGASLGPPKVNNMESFLDLVRNPPEGYGVVKEVYRSCTNIDTAFTTEQVLLECVKDGQCDDEELENYGSIYKAFLKHLKDIAKFTEGSSGAGGT